MNSSSNTPNNIKETIKYFFKHQGLLVDTSNSYTLLNEIIKDSQKGIEGKKSSLPMLNTLTSRKINISSFTNRQNILKLVIDAGGTNLRIVVVHFYGKNHELVYYKKEPMPGSKGEISTTDFFKQIVNYLKPILDNNETFKRYDPNFKYFDTLQLCFSYPTKMDDTGEGYVHSLTKEIKINGIIGQPLRKHLLDTLTKFGYSFVKNIIILNDTTATLLAGCYKKLIDNQLNNYDGLIGIVWGTGFNIAYEENSFFSKKVIVNSEAGNYNKFPMNNLDHLIDSSSLQPGKGLAEKKISGYYFGIMCKSLLTIFLKKHPEANSLFSETLKKIILDSKVELRSEHISQLLSTEKEVSPKFFFKHNGNETNEIITWSDQNLLQNFIDYISHRSSYFTSLIVTALMVRSMDIDIQSSKLATSPNKKFCIILDGSMIRKMPGLQQLFVKYLSELCHPLGITFDTIEIDKAPIIGTALATFDLEK